jgi:hypothetical protein
MQKGIPYLLLLWETCAVSFFSFMLEVVMEKAHSLSKLLGFFAVSACAFSVSLHSYRVAFVPAPLAAQVWALQLGSDHRYWNI